MKGPCLHDGGTHKDGSWGGCLKCRVDHRAGETCTGVVCVGYVGTVADDETAEEQKPD